MVQWNLGYATEYLCQLGNNYERYIVFLILEHQVGCLNASTQWRNKHNINIQLINNVYSLLAGVYLTFLGQERVHKHRHSVSHRTVNFITLVVS